MLKLNYRDITRGKWEAAILFLLVTLLSIKGLAFYVRFDFNFLLLLLVLPFVIRQRDNKKSLRYGYISVALLGLYFFVHLSTIFFFAYVCALFFLYESSFRKLTSIPLFLVIVISPIAIFFTEVIGFEIRLYLTQFAVKLLQFINSEYEAFGNIISCGNKEFRVDPECMGLKMMLLSFFISLVFISYQQNKCKSKNEFIKVIILLIITFVLVVISNLFRIVIITLFESSPGSISHQIIGIVCFIMYVIIPMWFLVKLFLNGLILKVKMESEIPLNNKVRYVLSGIILLLFLVFNIADIEKTIQNDSRFYDLEIPGELYEKSMADHGVLKLENENVLVYIKPAVGFSSSEHTPLICWKGSGYKIKNEQIIDLVEQKVFYGELSKDNDTLYSTWWYDSGSDKTISQFKWRSNTLIKNKDYRLINIICSSKEELYLKSKKLLQLNLFQKIN